MASISDDEDKNTIDKYTELIIQLPAYLSEIFYQ